ncbi:cation:proton antiporter [Chitinimonas arctica]|uniref:Cation:proton antiporter n=1 Tax=Chitinimonas arctica TaxID=2594795 RepID=A0A516SKT5_9NEIS|nr:cation:proton antiporter [Chitinimonas arctica]QDQ28733.1 cation:proton antiporter [Chitinimonas arctica]
MHGAHFIQDLAVIMLVAGLVTVLFHKLKQPVVLGYLIAGLIIGPHTPPYTLITDEATINTLAELGVVFLMFSLGLEFSLKKLTKVGAAALVAASAEIVLMVWIGYEVGRAFGWRTMDSLFLGAMLSISSTTIIVKALDELKLKQEGFAKLIFGVLIVEDVLAIAMLALLSGIAMTGSVQIEEVGATLGKLAIFITVALVAGLLLVPRLLAYVAQSASREMLLVTVLGICFGFCLFALKLGYSVALGAFIIGAVMAESEHLKTIENLIEPIRDLFSAIFFVAIGLMLNPAVLVQYAWPIALLTIVVVVGKVVSCGLGVFISGNDPRTSLRVGMGLAQIGEFSFIIAALGASLKVTSDFLYPIAVAVSAITTLLTPYLIKGADQTGNVLGKLMPRRTAEVLGVYSQWLASLRLEGDQAVLAGMIRRILLQVAVNCMLVAAIFLGGAWLGEHLSHLLNWYKAVLWGAALLLSLPFLVAIYRKLVALAMLLAEIGIADNRAGTYTPQVRKLVSRLIPLAALVGIGFGIAALSAAILPPWELLWLVLAIALLLLLVLHRAMVAIHARLQIALLETLEDNSRH